MKKVQKNPIKKSFEQTLIKWLSRLEKFKIFLNKILTFEVWFLLTKSPKNFKFIQTSKSFFWLNFVKFETNVLVNKTYAFIVDKKSPLWSLNQTYLVSSAFSSSKILLITQSNHFPMYSSRTNEGLRYGIRLRVFRKTMKPLGKYVPWLILQDKEWLSMKLYIEKKTIHNL